MDFTIQVWEWETDKLVFGEVRSTYDGLMEVAEEVLEGMRIKLHADKIYGISIEPSEGDPILAEEGLLFKVIVALNSFLQCAHKCDFCECPMLYDYVNINHTKCHSPECYVKGLNLTPES